MENTIIKVKTWTITVTEFSDGTSEMLRTNDGFSPHELLGITEHVKHDIFNQLYSDVNPTVVKRKVVK